MNARRAASMIACATIVLAALGRGAGAAVRVDQDEVIFTLHIPEATDVYLIGDFNQWNPTVERMNRIDDHFEIGLFLVAGDYHYQFVVDGKTISDPDNPARASERGSALRLIERGDGLILSTDVPSAPGTAPRASVGVRYIGALRARDDTDTNQRVDMVVDGRYERLHARAVVATDDSSWTWSPPSIDAFFDRGRVEVRMDKLTATGFENDSLWTSNDPTALVGNAGVYGYDAGYRRHGVSAVGTTSHAAIRALYADATTRAPAATAAIPGADLSGFVAGAAADTSVYATRPSFDATDVLAAELALSLHATGAGIVYRREQGANPGVGADLTRGTTDFTAEVFATRENRSVTSAWIRRDGVLGARVTGTYGWGGVDVHATGRGSAAGDLSHGVDAAAATDRVDLTRPLLDTRRGLIEVSAGADDRRHGSARWDYTRFDVDGVAGSGRADVHRVTVAAGDVWKSWTLGASAEYTDTDYGQSPDALAIDWPELNPWLSIWDAFDVSRMVALAFDRYDAVTLSATRAGKRATGGAAIVLGMEDVAGDLVHMEASAHADWSVRGPWYVYADARAAWYDDAAWTSGGTVWSGYLETGYRRGGVTVNAGVGFDPSVFDPVRSEYADIGRSELLRQALAGGVRRSRADDIVRSLIEQERRLEDAGVFKLECVIDLR